MWPPLAPSAQISLAVCWQGGMECLYPLYCQIEESQGSRKDDPDPKPGLLSLALGRACAFV